MKTQAVSTWRERTGHGIVTRTREAGMDRRWAEEKEEKKRKKKEKRKTTTQRTTARFKPRSTTAPVCDARMLSRSLAKINRTSVREKWGPPLTSAGSAGDSRTFYRWMAVSWHLV